ncbi:MAG: ankyrin repeat domain-containing protein, partial [Rickettsia endosymbiont of Labidopullus appendiculatus]|nr:ankyrin repeat domain-containing protein [Rickettsia endosymbiont of Labidopullus appendiculatus]
MTNPEEPTSVLEETTPLPEKLKPLKALYIVGPDLTIHNKTKALFDNRDDCLIVGDGIAAVSVKEIARILQEEGLKITQDTRIDIYAHGCRTNDGQHGILTNNPNQKITLTKQFLQELRKMADCPLNIHVWSCYGGSANKAASELKTGSTLVTHGESKSSSSPQLDAYSMIASLERYLNSEIGITSEQQFIFGYPEHLQPATFNKVGTKGKIYKFKFTRMRTSQDNKSKDKKMADILKNLSAKDNLTDYFNAFFKQEGERFQKTFEDSKVTNAINYVSKLDEQTIKTFATGVLIHLCGITTDDELNYLKELLDNLLQKGININDSIHGTTCLHRACGKGKISVIEILLKNGAEINAKNENGTIPLHWACSEGHSAVVTILLENGAEINAKNENG